MPKNSRAKIKANQKYSSKAYREFKLRIRKDDKKLISWIESKESINAYLLSLVAKDMN